jgi:hypothetical protein
MKPARRRRLSGQNLSVQTGTQNNAVSGERAALKIRSELGRQIAVDFEADADLDESWCRPRHWHYLLLKVVP